MSDERQFHAPTCPKAVGLPFRCDCGAGTKRVRKPTEAEIRADERAKFCDCPAAFTRYKSTHEAEVRERIAQAIEAVDPVEWALAGQDAGRQAATIARQIGGPA